MIINGTDYPSIGHMRAKALPDGEWQLEIYPPTQGPLMGHEPATMAEVTVSAAELERIDRVAPHLVTDRFRRDWASRFYPFRKQSAGSAADA
ncbi:hypothetical protein ACWPM1_09720 [Tsuneonella sp. HG249]